MAAICVFYPNYLFKLELLVIQRDACFIFSWYILCIWRPSSDMSTRLLITYRNGMKPSLSLIKEASHVVLILFGLFLKFVLPEEEYI